MQKIQYDILRKNLAQDDIPFRIKDITITLEMHGGEEFQISLCDTQNRVVELKTKMYGHLSLPMSDIVMISPMPQTAGNTNGNNKLIHFVNRRPDVLCNFSLSRDLKERWGLSGNELLCLNRAVYVNRSHILSLGDHSVIVEFMNEAGDIQKQEVKASRTCWSMLMKGV